MACLDSIMDQLETHIQALKEVQAKLQNLRHLPQQVLRPTGGVIVSAQFQLVKDLTDQVCSNSVQDALKAANESEKKDFSGLNPQRREIRKRR
jgi:hypothetical protein